MADSISSDGSRVRAIDSNEQCNESSSSETPRAHIYLLASDAIPAGIVVLTFESLKMQILTKARLLGADQGVMLLLFEMLLRCEEYVYRVTHRLEFTELRENLMKAVRIKISTYYALIGWLERKGMVAKTDGQANDEFHFEVFSPFNFDREIDPNLFQQQFQHDGTEGKTDAETPSISGEDQRGNGAQKEVDNQFQQDGIPPGRARQDGIPTGRARQDGIPTGRARQDGIGENTSENAGDSGTKNALRLSLSLKARLDSLKGESPKTHITPAKIDWLVKHPKCTDEKVRRAVLKYELLKKEKTPIESVEALFVTMITKWGEIWLPPTAEEKRLEKLSEHQQESFHQAKEREIRERLDPTIDPAAETRDRVHQMTEDEFFPMLDAALIWQKGRDANSHAVWVSIGRKKCRTLESLVVNYMQSGEMEGLS